MKQDDRVARVDLKVDGDIANLWLHNPTKLNAMTLQMWSRLAELVTLVRRDDAVKVIVVRGWGTQAFSTGADISEFPSRRATPSDFASYNSRVARCTTLLQAVRKPTIAVIHGWCVGGGASIAVACGLRFASPDLKFQIPAAHIGLSYPVELTSPLVRLIGPSAAYDLLVSGRIVDADEALRIGLVNRVHRSEELDGEAASYARQLGAGAPLSQAAARVAVLLAEDPANKRLAAELAAFERRIASSDDYAEGVDAFVSKRKARFTGK